MPKLSRIVVAGCALAVVAVTGLAVSTAGGGASASPPSAASRAVTVDVPSGVSASGTVESGRTCDLSFATAGTISSLTVKAGQKVKKGAVIGRVDATAAEESRSAAYSSYLAAAEALDKANDGAHASAYAGYVKARNAYRKAQRAVEGTRIVAPFAGTITAVNAQTGTEVTAGTAVYTLADMTDLRVAAEFSEADTGRLKKGREATIVFDSLGTSVRGKVLAVAEAPVASKTSSTSEQAPGQQSSNAVVRYRVLVSLDDVPATARTGQAVTVEVAI